MLWYSLEVPHRGAANEYLQHIFLWRDKKNMQITPLMCSYSWVFLCVCVCVCVCGGNFSQAVDIMSTHNTGFIGEISNMSHSMRKHTF